MIDLHCHILPGIDDGARTLEQAVAMCRAAAAAGCEALFATPHQRRGSWWNCDREALAALRAEVQAAVGPTPRILAGGEIHVDPYLLDEMRAMAAAPGGHATVAEGPQPLAGSHYLLIELAGATSPAAAGDLVHELAVAGWKPVLAHPEHFPWLAGDPAALEHLIALGALAQVTAMSITGEFGRRTQADTYRLIDRGLVHFVASDAHDLVRRPPSMQAAWRAVTARWGEAAARELMVDNPRAVMTDRPHSTGAIPVIPADPAGHADPAIAPTQEIPELSEAALAALEKTELAATTGGRADAAAALDDKPGAPSWRGSR